MVKSERSVATLDLLAFLRFSDEAVDLMSFVGRRRGSLSLAEQEGRSRVGRAIQHSVLLFECIIRCVELESMCFDESAVAIQ